MFLAIMYRNPRNPPTGTAFRPLYININIKDIWGGVYPSPTPPQGGFPAPTRRCSIGYHSGPMWLRDRFSASFSHCFPASFFDRFWIDFGSQNRAKMDQKSKKIHHACKSAFDFVFYPFLDDFSVNLSDTGTTKIIKKPVVF